MMREPYNSIENSIATGLWKGPEDVVDQESAGLTNCGMDQLVSVQIAAQGCGVLILCGNLTFGIRKFRTPDCDFNS